jgi:hypothetical protein
MPARYDTIIVVRKTNARGDAVEYHTVGRSGPSIWRTGQPNPPGTPGYQAAYDAAIGVRAVLEPSATGNGWSTVSDLLDAYERSREFCGLAQRTRTDYLRGLADVRARYGGAPLGIVNTVAVKGNVLDWVEARWSGKVADLRLNAFKFALSWASFRHPERVAINYLNGIPCFYRGADRAEIIWEDADVELFCRLAPEPYADAVRLARETGLRIGDLVELERGEIRTAPSGARAIVLRPNKRRHRIVNMPLTPAAEAIVDKAPLKRRLILKPARAEAWSSIHLSREVRDYATRFGIRRDLRFNDLRGTKVTELVWSGIGVADLAVRMGWKLETAAKMMGIYAALNPGRAH